MALTILSHEKITDLIAACLNACDNDHVTFNLKIVYRSMRSVCTCPFSYFDWLIIKLKERKKEIFFEHAT